MVNLNKKRKNKIKVTLFGFIFDRINDLVLFLVVLVTLYPMIYILMASLSNGNELIKHTGILLWPKGTPTLAAYEMVLGNPAIIKGFGISVFIVVAGTAISLILTSMGAYFLSRKNVLFGTPIMMFIAFTMFFRAGLVPEFLIYKELGFVNNIWAPILPFAINTFNLIILRTAFFGIPDSLEESARIDGAGHVTILTKIMLPLLKPTLAVITLYYAVYYWNSWFWPSLLIRDKSMYPLQVIMRDILIAADSEMLQNTEDIVTETVKFATIMVSTIPILFVYPYLQKYFVKGVMIGAVKG